MFATRLGGNLRLGLVVGFSGGFSTFSAFRPETAEPVGAGSPALGLLDRAVSMLLGVAVIGLLIGELPAAWSRRSQAPP